MDRRTFIAATSTALLAPAAAAGSPAGETAFATDPDAAILNAWQRRVAAYAVINSETLGPSDKAADPHWHIVDECDKLIQSTVAKTPLGIETQIWVALHNSAAYVLDEENAILRMDLEYVAQHTDDFDWAAMPMVAALRSLRAMGDA
ncbi:hypothetical protein [Novosphingobium cyanobacteriorum]|uniref:Twin-arginine translocation pathway signal n=1 Tax=Novosphingobium cyanobacteriorum TaxID=3024215 RepID=A0ABT6CJP0_9SPHN|nr:hypothetical protein [Novosphingobium cyanobacteriorum]MDF8334139.1 hypothetical protein [Novosphingobium cyanobacteriorum]